MPCHHMSFEKKLTTRKSENLKDNTQMKMEWEKSQMEE